MPKILELEQHVADLIAAGEVVQRPASVVKELIENSLDAGAGIITVEISSGGMSFIRVTDNGCGIAPDDVKTAFLRHATSKLKDAHSLEAVNTLGFRGEALAAIAAVSRIELLTREPGAGEGISLALEAGKIVNLSPAGCPEGSTIIVRDLFYNTPARLKFTKTDRAEGSGVSSVVLRCALSHPGVSVRFIKDGRTEYHTPGDSKVDSCIYCLLGREMEAGFLGAESSDESVTVCGYVSAQSAARGNRSYQFFFVNGRSIRSLLLQSALEQAYKNTLPTGRFPSCVLYITIKPSDVDVNVHPAKTEVKFASDKSVFDAVYYAALGALERKEPQISVSGARQADLPGNRVYSQTVKSGSRFKTKSVDEFRNTYVSEPTGKYKSPAGLSSESKLIRSEKPVQTELDVVSAQIPSSPFRVIGEALNMYIIVEHRDSVWFIDKHAAHERIVFDALKSAEHQPMSESLITPVICRLGHENTTLLLENTAFLDTLGFAVESFGEDAVAVRQIPAEIDIGDTESVLLEICPELTYCGNAASPQLDSIYKTISCKAAVKAGRSSDMRELESLASTVISGEVSFCPHGRPVAFEMTKTALDKGMGRL